MITKIADNFVDLLHSKDKALKDVPSKESVVNIFKNKYNINADEHILDENTLNNLYHFHSQQKPDSIKKLNNLISILQKNENNASLVSSLSKMKDNLGENIDRDSIFIDKKYENSVPMVAHEYGHAMNFNNKFLAANRKIKDNLPFLSVPFILGNAMHIAGSLSDNKPLSIAGNVIRTSTSAPELIDEYYASKNARKVLQEAGLKERPTSLDHALGSHLKKHLAVQGTMYLMNKGIGTLVRKMV